MKLSSNSIRPQHQVKLKALASKEILRIIRKSPGTRTMNDENWKSEYKEMKFLKPAQIKLLEEGPQSQSQAWLINNMWSDWKDIKCSADRRDQSLKALNHKQDTKDPWED